MKAEFSCGIGKPSIIVEVSLSHVHGSLAHEDEHVVIIHSLSAHPPVGLVVVAPQCFSRGLYDMSLIPQYANHEMAHGWECEVELMYLFLQ